MTVFDLDDLKSKLAPWRSRELSKLSKQYNERGAPELDVLNRDVERFNALDRGVARRLFEVRKNLLLISALVTDRLDFHADRDHDLRSTRSHFDSLVSCGHLQLERPLSIVPDAPVRCPLCSREIRLRLIPVLESRPGPGEGAL